MSWAFGQNSQGKTIGYSVRAVCEHPGCEKQIDRGLSFACGGEHEDDYFCCDGYFCGEHLRSVERADNGESIGVCESCMMIGEKCGFWVED